MSALKTQIAGTHYKDKGIQPVELWAANNLDAFQGAIVKYIMRWKDKGGIEDLEKCKHILEIYMEFIKEGKINTNLDVKEEFVEAEKDYPKDPNDIPEFNKVFGKSVGLRGVEKKPLGYYMGRPIYSWSDVPSGGTIRL